MTTVPDVIAVATYLGQETWDIEPAYEAEVEAQAAACVVDPYNSALAAALCRRVARHLAMKNLPLGVVLDETGGTRIGTTDPEVRRLEGPWRRVRVG